MHDERPKIGGKQNLGFLPIWNDGIMEYWNDGFKEFYLNSNRCFHFYTQYSIIPRFQHS